MSITIRQISLKPVQTRHAVWQASGVYQLVSHPTFSNGNSYPIFRCQCTAMNWEDFRFTDNFKFPTLFLPYPFSRWTTLLIWFLVQRTRHMICRARMLSTLCLKTKWWETQLTTVQGHQRRLPILRLRGLEIPLIWTTCPPLVLRQQWTILQWPCGQLLRPISSASIFRRNVFDESFFVI